MGAFNAEQVMYNHFGYRTPIPNLYMAGSPCHPGGAISGGAGYIAAGLIARDLGIKTWWQPWDARARSRPWRKGRVSLPGGSRSIVSGGGKHHLGNAGGRLPRPGTEC